MFLLSCGWCCGYGEGLVIHIDVRGHVEQVARSLFIDWGVERFIDIGQVRCPNILLERVPVLGAVLLAWAYHFHLLLDHLLKDQRVVHLLKGFKPAHLLHSPWPLYVRRGQLRQVFFNSLLLIICLSFLLRAHRISKHSLILMIKRRMINAEIVPMRSHFGLLRFTEYLAINYLRLSLSSFNKFLLVHPAKRSLLLQCFLSIKFGRIRLFKWLYLLFLVAFPAQKFELGS